MAAGNRSGTRSRQGSGRVFEVPLSSPESSQPKQMTKKARVVSFLNYKGGVGKTTTTYHIGCYLAGVRGKKVLLVDIDPQTNLTFLCADYERWERFKGNKGTIASLYKRYQDKLTLDTRRFIWRDLVTAGRHAIGGLDLIPCDIELLGEDIGGVQLAGTFPSMEAMRKQSEAFLRERSFLVRTLDEVRSQYDYILIDCPPNLYLMTQNALLASDYYIIPTIPDHLSTIGLNILQRKIDKISELVDAAAKFAGDDRGLQFATLGGVIFVRVRIGGDMITNAHAETMDRVKGMVAGAPCFETYTTELIGYTEAAMASVPVWLHQSPNAQRAAKKDEYQDISEEFMRRI